MVLDHVVAVHATLAALHCTPGTAQTSLRRSAVVSSVHGFLQCIPY